MIVLCKSYLVLSNKLIIFTYFFQAWIVFHDLNSAINAMKGKQGFVFYDKPMVRVFGFSMCAQPSKCSHICSNPNYRKWLLQRRNR